MMDQHAPELIPLEAGVWSPPKLQTRQTRYRRQTSSPLCHLTAVKVCRLLLLLILTPAMLILLPLYLRYRVYSGQMYPMSMTDMRLIDSKISPMWCQRQVVKSEATFNAYVVPEAPSLSPELVQVTMNRTLHLDDDMKEYWGFYLLKGSSVTVSACVRYPGASLIMIKGYKHLQNCAYIGDDSSEELDELTEAYELGLLSDDLYKQKYEEKKEQLKKVDGEANRPGKMTRHNAGVSFHGRKDTGSVSPDTVPSADVTDHDPKELRELLEHLHALREAAKNERFKHYRPPSHLMSLPGLHRHRDTNVDKNERQWLEFQDIDGNSSGQETTMTKDASEETELVLTTEPNVDDLNKIKKVSEVIANNRTDNRERDGVSLEIKENNTPYAEENKVGIETQGIKEDLKKVEIYSGIEKKNRIAKTKLKPGDAARVETAQEPNSKEVYKDIMQRLQALGDTGQRVLVKLQESLVKPTEHSVKEVKVNASRILSSLSGNDQDLDHLHSVIQEAVEEEKTRAKRQAKRREANEAARVKRETMLAAIELTKQFNEDDEERNLAQEEEEFSPDGYAEHHSTVNETSPLDMSNSEFWSSFSSSEEALLECEGLILNLPLTPGLRCTDGAQERDFEHAAKANALTYRVPSNGYYFFIFNSENEVQTNTILARFSLLKARYDLARVERTCLNDSQCHMQLDAFSAQKVVLEVPLRNNDSLWNEQVVVVSECEPRTALYLACVLAVPVLVLVFGFQ